MDEQPAGLAAIGSEKSIAIRDRSIAAAILRVINRKGEAMHSFVGYLDPGSGSLILQAVVGGFSGIVVLVRFLWNQWLTRRPVT